MSNIAVFGLGSMGYGIAQSCLRAGHRVFGVDTIAERSERFRAEGGADGDANAAAQDLDAVVAVVLNAAQVEAVLFGKGGIAPMLRQGASVIVCATVPPDFARVMAGRCAAHDLHYLDAPISGGSVKAAAGQLTVMASGTPEAFAAARPVLDAAAETVFTLGDDAGIGSAMKAVNQLLAGVHIAAMAEALTFGMTQGVSPEQFLAVISKCAGTSWMLENRAPHIVAGDYTAHSQIAIWPKDLGIVLETAKSAGFSTPLAAAAMQQYLVAVGQGLAQEDDAAIAKVYARNAGLRLPGDS